MATAEEQVQTTGRAEPEPEEPSFELGDRIMIVGGRLDGLRGRIYYLDETLIQVLPDGVSDRLVDVPIVDGDVDPTLAIDHLYLLNKRSAPAFVTQIDAQVGQRAETFGQNGEEGAVYTIQAIDEANDELVLIDSTGAELRVSANFTGLPRDLPFQVLRPRQPPSAEAPAMTEEEEAMLSAETAAEEEEEGFEDVLEEELKGELGEDDVVMLREIPKAQRYYPDLIQRNDMLQSFLAALDAAAQKNPANQKGIRQLIEQCMQLRNDVTRYSLTGEPLGGKQTSYSTLNDLLTAQDVALARPVLKAKKVLYLDHSAEDILRKAQGNPTQDPIELPDVEVAVRYLEDVVNETVRYMETELGGLSAGGGGADGDELPNWFQSWETLNRQLGASWIPSLDLETLQFRTDKEFLRAPADDLETAQVDGLPAMPQATAEKWILTPDAVTKVKLGLQRGLGPRSTRLRPKDPPRRVESAEEAPVVNTAIFPISEQRNLGVTRSGSIALDVSLSHQPPQSMGDIVERLEGIPDAPTAGGILLVGDGGNTTGNIPVEDWLKAQPLIPQGLGDVRIDLANYGLQRAELNVEQQEVFIEKIDAYRALTRQFITEARDLATKLLSQSTLQDSPFLTGEAFADVMELLRGEPLLAERIEELKKRLPAYKENDIALFAGLLATSADLVLVTLAQVPGPLARERNRRVRDQFLEVLYTAMAKTRKRLMAGEPPEPNRCPHVPSLVAIRKIKDDASRLQLFARLLAKFSGGREDNWVTCSVCSQNLVCYHEVLQLQEFLHPREKDTLHKELLLTFSGGQFHGHYMCKNCGQGISELEFDTNMEFSDDGVPLSGRAPLPGGEAGDVAAEELDEFVSGPPGVGYDDELTFKTQTQTTIYKAARRLFDMVGIHGVQQSYQNIVQRVEAEILKQPSREEYGRITKGRKAIDYDVLLNRILVASLGANALIEIQTNIPGYVMRYKLPGCRAGFTGYPLGQEKDRTGLEYIACAIAAIRDPVAPWNLAGFQQESNDKRRFDAVLAATTKLLDAHLTNAGVQQQLQMKRAYLKQLYGAEVLKDELPELLPERFAPAPYAVNEEEASKTEVVANASKPREAVRGWVQEAHRLGKKNGTYAKETPYAEATCCVTRIQEPGVFWREMADKMVTLPKKQPPRGPVRSHLGMHIRPRALQTLEGEVSKEIIYRIFLKVCYQGPRKGLPHEPGSTNLCPHCGFTFPESPYVPQPFPPMSANSKTQKELMGSYVEEVNAILTKGRVALETQNVPVNEETFQEILDASHKAFRVEPPVAAAPTAGMRLFEMLRTITPEPFEGWREAMTATMERVSKVSSDGDELEWAEAYGPLSNVAAELGTELEARVGRDNAAALKAVLEARNPTECVETVRTYILVPFQRLTFGFVQGNLRVPSSYGFSTDTTKDLNGAIAVHLDHMGLLAKRATGLTLEKLRWARDRLAVALDMISKQVRLKYFPGGSVGVPYVIFTLVGGILAEFMNPNAVPPGAATGTAAIEAGARAPIQILDYCVQKMRLEGLNFTPEQIRDIVNARIEAEKVVYINRFDRLTPEEKAVEKMKKRLGLGEWAVGGTKAVYAYDPEQYERERLQRLEMGLQDFAAAGAIQDDGYDVTQTREDDA